MTAAARIRRALMRDVPVLMQLIRELADYEMMADQVTADEEALRSTLFAERPAAEALLVEDEGEVVGFALFFANYSTFRARPGIYLEDLFVRPDFRGRGHGKALMLEVARLARERGCARFEWSVLDWNESAIRFYESLGARMLAPWRIMRIDVG